MSRSKDVSKAEPAQENRQEIEEAFALFDKDSTGFIEIKDLKVGEQNDFLLYL